MNGTWYRTTDAMGRDTFELIDIQEIHPDADPVALTLAVLDEEIRLYGEVLR